ncbi:hypothetical protein M422DRAFT_269459 [Sphaerobolus stellatus SS14]|uniref:Uncharacterized protein n=1 Tax=Sphaerobolus stellatus (strain SS14) TaxID=990650 RepID=A0A0C9UJX5_SPHS4|nr:hypothetical protein M422DRAFT_269459 [Sphaerobolus stellatus SS14]
MAIMLSKFINKITRSSFPVHHGLRPSSNDIQFFAEVPSSRVVLVEVPWVETIREWSAVGARLQATLAQRFNGAKVIGIIYLHKISDIRLTEVLQDHHKVFALLCPRHKKNLVFLTTMWDITPKYLADPREARLRTAYWRESLASGAIMERYIGESSAGTRAIRHIAEKAKVPLAFAGK